jgi:hypothetical protein
LGIDNYLDDVNEQYDNRPDGTDPINDYYSQFL